MGLVAKAFQDIITFSRATAGTYVNSNGYITNSSVLNYLTYSNAPDNAAWTKSNSFVQTNLLTYSEDFANAAWSKNSSTLTSNATIAPDGTLTADKVISNVGVFGNISQAPTVVVSTVYTYSIYAKAAEFSWVRAQVNLITGTRVAWFNLASGSVGTVQSGLTASIVSVGNGFYRCAISAISDNTSGSFVLGATNADNSAANGDGVSGIYIWGAQLVQGSVPGNYVTTTSAALPVLYADYNGVVRARKLCEDTVAAVPHRIFQSPSTTTTSSFSIIAKAGERNWLYLRFIDASATIKQGWFNLTTGALGTIESGMTGTIQSAGNGYYRCTFTGPAFAGVNTTLIGISNADAVTTYTGDGSSGIYIADAQLNDGSSATAYYDTTASAYNAPRFDYDPVTLAAKGLLIEESRANLLLRSSDWTATWSNTNVTLGAPVLAPDGTVTATRLQATASAATNCYQSFIATATSHTYSIYTKQGSGAADACLFAMYNSTTASNLANLTINYSTGVITQTIGAGATATNAGNGYWRIVIPVSSGITIGNTLNVYAGFAGGVETAGEYAYVWGAQLEAGAFATSYMTTTTSQFTRAVDVASVNTLSPWFNAAAGTLYFEGDTAVPASLVLRNLTSMNDATVNNLNRTYLYNGTVGGSTTTGGVTQADIGGGSYTVNTVFKFAYATAANNFAAVLNGGAPATDALGTMPSGLTTFEIASSFAGTVNTGHIRRITYYPRRLSNTELQTLTTL
jgi:hypothetical protein